MMTVNRIITLTGGLDALKTRALKITSGSYMPLCIEWIGKGPRGYDLVSVCHYGEQNGDAMRDPDMTFEVWPSCPGSLDLNWAPVTYRNDYCGIEQEAVWVTEAGVKMICPKLVRELLAFARTWDRNLAEQGFLEAARAGAGVVPS